MSAARTDPPTGMGLRQELDSGDPRASLPGNALSLPHAPTPSCLPSALPPWLRVTELVLSAPVSPDSRKVGGYGCVPGLCPPSVSTVS